MPIYLTPEADLFAFSAVYAISIEQKEMSSEKREVAMSFEK